MSALATSRLRNITAAIACTADSIGGITNLPPESNSAALHAVRTRDGKRREGQRITPNSPGLRLGRAEHQGEHMTAHELCAMLRIDGGYLRNEAADLLEQQSAEIERQRAVIARLNAKCDHLGIRPGEVMRERDALKSKEQ